MKGAMLKIENRKERSKGWKEIKRVFDGGKNKVNLGRSEHQ